MEEMIKCFIINIFWCLWSLEREKEKKFKYQFMSQKERILKESKVKEKLFTRMGNKLLHLVSEFRRVAPSHSSLVCFAFLSALAATL